MFSAIHSVVLVLAASAPAGLPQGSVGQAHIPKTLLSAGSISKKTQGGTVSFGPKGCVSTWLNDQARCMIKTECIEKDIDNYDFKFICVDESGEHVRHVFGKGSFDPEETFDTLVTCTSCTADAGDLLVSAKQSRVEKNKTADGPTSTNALLREIVADVGELKVEMANATQNVERLNSAVFTSSTAAPPAAPPAAPATAVTPAPEEATEFLAHRGASVLRTKGRVSRLNAMKAHAKASKSHTHKIRRRHQNSEDDKAGQEDAQDLNGRVDNAQDSKLEDQSQDDSQVQDDSQDQDEARHQDDVQQQEDDDADRSGQADAGDADSEDEQRDDEHDQSRDGDRSVGNDHEQDDGDRDADDDGNREENVD